ncbi:MAG: tetratricopeptide repeat protein, partial [Verrucomicrobiota bacterium]
VPQDNKEAIRWYRLAADQGSTMAQRSLGFMYTKGKGVPPDDVQAYAWYSLAAANGDNSATLHKDARAEKMTPEQITRAQELSTELHKKISEAK